MVEEQIQKLEKAEGSVEEAEENEMPRENARQDDSYSETQSVISSSAPILERSVSCESILPSTTTKSEAKSRR